MRYIIVWDTWSKVPIDMYERVVPLLGTYFQELDAIDTINNTYGEDTWESLSPQDQQAILENADKSLEDASLDNWDEIVLDSIPEEIKAKLGEPLED